MNITEKNAFLSGPMTAIEAWNARRQPKPDNQERLF